MKRYGVEGGKGQGGAHMPFARAVEADGWLFVSGQTPMENGEVINGGFGMLLDGSEEAGRRLKSMLFYDVNNGIARRAWARNDEALFAIEREMQRTPNLKVTMPNLVDEDILKHI